MTLVATDLEGRASPSCTRAAASPTCASAERPTPTHDIERWATRLEPLLAGGTDAFVFFRHDDDGQMALHAGDDAGAAVGLHRAVTANGVGWEHFPAYRMTSRRSAKETP